MLVYKDPPPLNYTSFERKGPYHVHGVLVVNSDKWKETEARSSLGLKLTTGPREERRSLTARYTCWQWT